MQNLILCAPVYLTVTRENLNKKKKESFLHFRTKSSESRKSKFNQLYLVEIQTFWHGCSQ